MCRINAKNNPLKTKIAGLVIMEALAFPAPPPFAAPVLPLVLPPLLVHVWAPCANASA